MTARERTDFIRDIIDDDLRAGRHQTVRTRFPPEPNGYLHIGHAKSICLNFGLALEYRGTCNLRYDDTNPAKEDIEYVESIEHDVRWLGFAPTAVLFSADYFERMYQWAEKLVTDGKAYVCDLDDEQIRVYRGTLGEPGRPSPYRDRSVAENLDLLRRMRAGEFPDGARTLRAKIDMASANMKMRDPLLYRIRHASHHRTGDAWCIYPMYDYAHPLEDAIEKITHSICTLEFENNRELYDWVIEHTGAGGDAPPRQYEFARLNLDYTVMSKRKLLRLVEEGHVAGWDDPRMPTIAGMRRRGFSPEAIRAFCDMIGVAKNNSVVDVGKLEFCVRDDLNQNAPRVMGVVRPLEIEITTVSDDEELDAPYFPPDVGKPGSRAVPFTRTILIDRDDFQEEPEKDYLRLAPGRTVRLRYAYCITCDAVERAADGSIVKLRATHHPETRSGKPPADGRKVWGVLHWVSAAHSVPAEVRLYDRLCRVPRPEEGGDDFLANLNPRSLEIVKDARVEASLASAAPGSRWQLERVGYFVVDAVDAKPGALVLNRIVTLRDSWAGKAEVAVVEEKKERGPSAKSKTRPKSKSPAEYRAEARARDPELAQAFAWMIGELALGASEADLLSGSTAAVVFFRAAVEASQNAIASAKWIVNELPRVAGDREHDQLPFDGFQMGTLVRLVEDQKLTGPAAKDVLAEMAARGGDPAAIAAARAPVADAGAIGSIIDDVIAKHADKVAQYKAGKTGLLGFFVGQVVKASKGAADPQTASRLISERLA